MLSNGQGTKFHPHAQQVWSKSRRPNLPVHSSTHFPSPFLCFPHVFILVYTSYLSHHIKKYLWGREASNLFIFYSCYAAAHKPNTWIGDKWWILHSITLGSVWWKKSLVKLLFLYNYELLGRWKVLKIKALQNPQAVATRIPFGVLSLSLCDPLD